MVKFVLPILDKMDKLKFVYLLSRVNGYDGKLDLVEISRLNSFIIRILAIVTHYLVEIPYYKVRLFQELLLDYFISVKIHEASVLVSTAYLFKVTNKNKKLGGINIFLAGNPDDYDIHNLLINEQLKYGVSFNDAYTYVKRIDFISKAILSFDHIICFTIVELESYRKRIPSERISFIESHIIPNPEVFPEIEIVKNKELTFCYVAHTVWLKGLTYLLETWESIENDGSKLIVAGTIDREVKEYIDKKFKNLRNVSFIGRVEDLNKFYRNAHICIVPSLLDAGPATVAEAMYCGLPVIVSDGCGAKTLIDEGENGFVVPSGNCEAMAKKIQWFIFNTYAIASMGIKATNTIKKLAKSNQNKRVASHIMEVINGQKGNKR